MRRCGVRVHYNDLVVEDMLLVELRVVKALDDAHRRQCTAYLQATGVWLCLPLNFGKPRLEIKRVVHGL
jgi:GxxExxY protein